MQWASPGAETSAAGNVHCTRNSGCLVLNMLRFRQDKTFLLKPAFLLYKTAIAVPTVLRYYKLLRLCPVIACKKPNSRRITGWQVHAPYGYPRRVVCRAAILFYRIFPPVFHSGTEMPNRGNCNSLGHNYTGATGRPGTGVFLFVRNNSCTADNGPVY